MAAIDNDAWLRDKYSDREWFDSVGRDQFGRLVIYVKHMNFNILSEIPLELELDGRVLVHFADSKRITADDFKIPVFTSQVEDIEDSDIFDSHEDKNIESTDELCSELDRLEKICGSNILQDIFYEVHDGTNAVTNLSARYPEVRIRMEVLYDDYGFDIIYEELDG